MSECELCALCKNPIPTTAGGFGACAMICLNCVTKKVVSLEWLEKYCQDHQTLRDCVSRIALLEAAKKQAGEEK